MPEVWGIHNGGDVEADGVFLRKDHIAVRWGAVGDFSALQDREQFRAKFRNVYPDWSEKKAMVGADQAYRFSREMGIGDVVVYRSRIDRLVHVGIVKGPYKHAPNLLERFPNCREVTWEKSLGAEKFTDGFRFELGSALTFFKMKTHANEVLSVLTNTVASSVTAEAKAEQAEADENPSIEQIEDWARSFIIETLSTQLKGTAFEDFVKHLLECMGYRVNKTPANTPGVDLVVYRGGLGIEAPTVKVSVKSQSGSVDLADVNALFAQLGQGEIGLLVALSMYTSQAKKFADQKSNVRLIDGDAFVSLVFEHYEKFDANYRALLPLKKMYVPIVTEGST